MATKKSVSKPSPSKKEYKKDLAGKIESALSDLKTKLGDKKFQHRINKATKILAHGLHSKDIAVNGAAKAVAKKVKAAKKAKAKKQATAEAAN